MKVKVKFVLFPILWLCIAIVFVMFSISCFKGYFYPLKYYEKITLYSKNNDVSPSLVASIINTESGYNENCVSKKGAVGLMQIMPSTASWVAKMKGDDFKLENLSNPDVNIDYGTYYLRYLLDVFENEDLAICAYNAGPGNVKTWLVSKNYSKDGQKLDKIPFCETENYLKKVKKNLRFYKKKY